MTKVAIIAKKISAMNIIIAVIINFFQTSIWTIPLILLWAGLLNDLDTYQDSWIIIVSLIVNLVISGLIHLFIFLPGLILYKNMREEYSLDTLYHFLFPGLLLPLALYFYLSSLMLQVQEINQSNLTIQLFVAAGFMLIYSLSLYTFTQKINLFKTSNHEKNIESNM